VNLAATLKHLFTEQDGERWCPVRLFGIGFAILGSTTYLVLAVWTVIRQHHELDYVSFGTGLSAVWATVSAAIVFKAKFGDRKGD
jgi:hypothetical protein